MVEVKDDWGFNEKSFQPLWDTVEKYTPDHYRFLNPGMIYSYFLSHRVEEAEALVHELNSLKKSNSMFEDLQVKLTTKDRVVELDEDGRFLDVV